VLAGRTCFEVYLRNILVDWQGKVKKVRTRWRKERSGIVDGLRYRLNSPEDAGKISSPLLEGTVDKKRDLRRQK
jgi:hypothetical protein